MYCMRAVGAEIAAAPGLVLGAGPAAAPAGAGPAPPRASGHPDRAATVTDGARPGQRRPRPQAEDPRQRPRAEASRPTPAPAAMQQRSQGRQHHHRREHRRRRLVGLPAAGGSRRDRGGPPRPGARSRAAARPPTMARPADGEEEEHARARARRRSPLDQPEVDEPLADEGVQRAAARRWPPTPTSMSAPVQGMRPSSPPSRSRSGCRAVQHAARAQEQEPLEQRRGSRRAAGRRRRPAPPPRGCASAAPQEREAQTQQHDADVLDAGVGQHALEVPLVESQRDAQQRRPRGRARSRVGPQKRPGLEEGATPAEGRRGPA